MISNIKKIGSIISKKDQKALSGGIDPDPIGPIDPHDGGPSGGGGHRCVCFINFQVVDVPCNSLCPDGTAPICP